MKVIKSFLSWFSAVFALLAVPAVVFALIWSGCGKDGESLSRFRVGGQRFTADTLCRDVSEGFWACVSGQHVYLCIGDPDDDDIACGTFDAPRADLERAR